MIDGKIYFMQKWYSATGYYAEGEQIVDFEIRDKCLFYDGHLFSMKKNKKKSKKKTGPVQREIFYIHGAVDDYGDETLNLNTKTRPFMIGEMDEPGAVPCKITADGKIYFFYANVYRMAAECKLEKPHRIKIRSGIGNLGYNTAYHEKTHSFDGPSDRNSIHNIRFEFITKLPWGRVLFCSEQN